MLMRSQEQPSIQVELVKLFNKQSLNKANFPKENTIKQTIKNNLRCGKQLQIKLLKSNLDHFLILWLLMATNH